MTRFNSRYSALPGSAADILCPSFRPRRFIVVLLAAVILLTLGSLSTISSASSPITHLPTHSSPVFGETSDAPILSAHVNPFNSSEILYFPHKPLPKTTFLPFSATYVINRQIRSDRRAGIISLAHHFNDLPLYITPATEQTSQLVSETRTIITERYKNAIAASQSQSWWNRIRIKPPSLSDVELAVWASHARIWKEVATRRLSSALVLEDDVDAETFMPKVILELYGHMPEDWDMVYLGVCNIFNGLCHM